MAVHCMLLVPQLLDNKHFGLKEKEMSNDASCSANSCLFSGSFLMRLLLTAAPQGSLCYRCAMETSVDEKMSSSTLEYIAVVCLFNGSSWNAPGATGA